MRIAILHALLIAIAAAFMIWAIGRAYDNLGEQIGRQIPTETRR